MLELFAETVERYRVLVHCYVLMGNHFHLVVQTPDANLSQAMQWLNQSYAAWFNTRHQRTGPVYQRPFGSKPIQDGAWAYELSTYVHLNPLRIKEFKLSGREKKAAGQGLSRAPGKEEIGRRLRKLRTYPWSSYLSYAGYRDPPDWLCTEELLKRASKSREERTRRYRQSVQGLLKQGGTPDNLETLRDGVAIGGAEFVARMRDLAHAAGMNRETAGKRSLRERLAIEEVIQAVEKVKGERREQFATRHGDSGAAMVMWLARRCTGLTLKEIGQAVNGKDYAAVHMAIKRLESRAAEDRLLRRTMRVAAKMLNVEMSPQ